MKVYGTVVISVITRQNGNVISKHIQTLFIEVFDTIVIIVIARPNGSEI